MKNLFVKRLSASTEITIDKAAHLLEAKAVSQSIDSLNWEKTFPYKPDLKFRIGHADNKIWLKFYVKEKNILAQETRINGDVYKDSTVEFFISLDGENYYNFEFSCIGTPHVGYGPGRGNRTFVAADVVEQIERKSTLGTQPFAEKSGNFEWEMMLRIPTKCFTFDKLKSFKGIKATANFYKCGDETSDPHFVSWNPIKTENPDYHQLSFFGGLEFE